MAQVQIKAKSNVVAIARLQHRRISDTPTADIAHRSQGFFLAGKTEVQIHIGGIACGIALHRHPPAARQRRIRQARAAAGQLDFFVPPIPAVALDIGLADKMQGYAFGQRILQGSAQFERDAGIEQQALFALPHLQLADFSAAAFLCLRWAGQAQGEQRAKQAEQQQ